MDEVDLLVVGGRVVTCDGADAAEPTERLGVLEDGAVAVRDGRIAWVGARANAPKTAAQTLHVGGRLVVPGLVDPHTHLVFAGSRVQEFNRRMAGEDYRTIAAEGGGIKASVRATREASDEVLYEGTLRRALMLRRSGVTTVEIKSGYGLSLEHEMRQLAVGRRLAKEGHIRTTTTLLGAHALPQEFAENREEYLRLVCEEMIPLSAERDLADACDVYLDEGAFTRSEAGQVLQAGRAHGLKLRAHVGQFADLEGAQLCAELGALSADHLEQVSDDGLRAMAKAGVVAGLLPGAWTTLRQTPPDGERMRAFGVRMAVGTDANPGTSPCLDLALCAALAVRDAGLTIAEAILGMTVEAARAVGMHDVGRLAPGYHADMVVYEAETPEALGYGLGAPAVKHLLLGGKALSDSHPDGPVW